MKTIKTLINWLSDIPNKDLPVTVMQEVECGNCGRLVQTEYPLTDIGYDKRNLTIIGHELLVPDWEKPKRIIGKISA